MPEVTHNGPRTLMRRWRQRMARVERTFTISTDRPGGLDPETAQFAQEQGDVRGVRVRVEPEGSHRLAVHVTGRAYAVARLLRDLMSFMDRHDRAAGPWHVSPTGAPAPIAD
jgi:hypothetical protein